MGRIKELKADLANYKNIAAKSYTACGNYQERIKELEEALRTIINSLAIIKNINEDVPVLIKRLKEYAEQALKGARKGKDA